MMIKKPKTKFSKFWIFYRDSRTVLIQFFNILILTLLNKKNVEKSEKVKVLKVFKLVLKHRKKMRKILQKNLFRSKIL